MVKLRDIAIKTGFNISTVSKALRNATDISPDTCRLVRQAARELGYRYRKSGSHSSKTIAVILPEVTSHYYAELAHSFSAEISRKSYNMLLTISGFTIKGIHDAYNLLLEQEISGVLICGIEDTEELQHDSEFLRQLTESEVPVVLLSEMNSPVAVDLIYVDSERCMQIALEHLISLGHKRIGYVGEFLSDSRYHAMCSQMKKIGIVPRSEFIKRGTERFEIGGYLRTKELLSEKELPTAIIASYDQFAFGAMRALNEAGLHIPEDISVIGFDNTIMDDYLNVKLTSVTNPVGQMGTIAVKLLLDHIQNREDHVVQNVALQSKLITRDSTSQNLSGK